VKAPGWASLMTLLSDTAYHSFIGEVEALNTTTICRLTPSCRHQLRAIALLRNPMIIAPIGAQRQALLTERLPSTVELATYVSCSYCWDIPRSRAPSGISAASLNVYG
jgi:hypothetical protein